MVGKLGKVFGGGDGGAPAAGDLVVIGVVGRRSSFEGGGGRLPSTGDSDRRRGRLCDSPIPRDVEAIALCAASTPSFPLGVSIKAASFSGDHAAYDILVLAVPCEDRTNDSPEERE